MDAAIDPVDPSLDGHRPSELPVERAWVMGMQTGGSILVCGTVPPKTSSGKVELYSAELEARYGYGVPRYRSVEAMHPLMLITPSSKRRTNATFGGESGSAGLQRIEIHPRDAEERGIAGGAMVPVWNGLGEVVLCATLSTALPPGVFYSSKGTWLATSPSGQTVNALLSADLRTDIMDGACYNETYVEVEPAPASTLNPCE